MRRISVFMAGAILCFAQEPTIRVDVNLVRVLATVKNPAGELVGSLEKGDFEVFDNGVRQEIAVFERKSALPLSVAVMIDTSGSTAKELKYETEAVHRFYKALFADGNREDSAALYSFNWRVSLEKGYTRSVVSLESRLRGLKAEAGTSLYDAIYLASDGLEQREGRRVMVIVTDGGDTVSKKDFNAAVRAARMADAVIYPVVVMPITNDAGRNVGGENALTTMAQWTGGRTFLPTVGPELDRAFAEIIRDLRTQYLLGFYPRNAPATGNGFHPLTVKAVRPELRVSARNGYYGESSSGKQK